MFSDLFSTELFSVRRIHPIQYALVAAAIAVFYVLLLAHTFAFFYILLQLEDYAVLAGSLAIFAVLACIMVYTRGVDWYSIQRDEK